MFDLNDVERISEDQLYLQISQIERKTAWEETQNHSNAVARFDAYLNHLCLYTFYKWLSKWLEEEESVPQPVISPSENSLSSIWEVVNGSAIALGTRRIILIPHDINDLEELRVPQEWVDIPSWAGDYYLATQVDLDADVDDCSMLVLGFTTHRQLKSFGHYDQRDRTYILPVKKLTTDLTVMMVTLGLKMRAEIPELPILSDKDAEKLLQLLSDKSVYAPRLLVDKVSFEQWAGLLLNNKWRENLYDRRMGKIDSQAVAVSENKITNSLRQWRDNKFCDSIQFGWKNLEEVFQELFQTETLTPSQVYSFSISRQFNITRKAKILSFKDNLGKKQIALIITQTQKQNQQIDLLIQIYPTQGKKFRLAVFSESGDQYKEVSSANGDDSIEQRLLNGKVGEKFGVKVTLGERCLTENFII
jgi:Protein of unknown function (DUF1822)